MSEQGHGGGEQLRSENLEARREQLEKILYAESGVAKENVIAGFLESEQRQLGWYNDTADLNKINDVELLLSTGYDFEFIRHHHNVRELLEANAELQAKKEIDTADGAVLSISDIYQSLKDGADGIKKGIRVNKVDASGELVGKQIDLYDYAHLKRIKKFYDVLDPEDRPMSWEALEEKFWRHEPIPATIQFRDKIGKPIENKKITVTDLGEYVKRPAISPEQFESYYETIRENQTSLQYLGTLRDPSILGHHAENGGHAQMDKGLGGELLYIPVSGRMAANYVRGDVVKKDARFRAAGHVHEIGLYEENTGISVAFEAEALNIWRGKVKDYHVHGATDSRMVNNLMALNSREQLMQDKENKVIWFGRRKEGEKDKHGKIYDAMHNHYDAMMKERRGYALTDAEAGDKIVTDIFAPHFATNRLDWLMTFSQVSGISTPQEMVSGAKARDMDGAGKPEFIFYAKRPKALTTDGVAFVTNEPTEALTRDMAAVGSYDYGEIRLKGFTAFAKYIRWRIENGDISEFTDASVIDVDFLSKIKEPKKGGAESGDADKEGEGYIPQASKIAQALLDIWGSDAKNVIDMVAGNVTTIEYTDASGKNITVTDEAGVRERIEAAASKDKKLFKALKEITNEKVPLACALRMVELLRKFVQDEDALTKERLIEEIDKL